MGMDVEGRGNPEAYFRANTWSWTPLMKVVEVATGEGVPISWHYNDGEGLETAEACRDLASKIRKYLKTVPESESFEVDLGVMMTDDGRLSPEGDRSAHTIRRSHVEEFCNFLDICEGFSIF